MARALDENKRIAILEAAKTVFLNVGYADAKISDIASAAGVAAGTLYLYYDSKEALASAIGELFFSRLSKQFGLVIKKMKDPDGVEAFVEWAIQISKQEKEVLSIAKEYPQSARSKPHARKHFLSQLAEVLQEAMARGEIRQYKDPIVLAEIVMSVIRRLLLSQAIYNDENTDTVKEVASELLKHALFDDAKLAP